MPAPTDDLPNPNPAPPVQPPPVVPNPNPLAPATGLSEADVKRQIDEALAAQKAQLEAEAAAKLAREKAEAEGKYKELWEESERKLAEQLENAARQEACQEAGLPANWASRLTGADKAAFVADAKRIKAEIDEAAKIVASGQTLTLPAPSPKPPEKNDARDKFREAAAKSFR